MARRPGSWGVDGPSTCLVGDPDRPRAAGDQTRADPLVPKPVMRSILGQAPGVDERAIDLGYPSDVGEDGGRSATAIGGRPP